MRVLLTPRWIIAHLVVLVVAVVFAGLGFWQLDRHEQRLVDNAVNQSRFGDDPIPLTELLSAAGSDFASLRFRRTSVTGVFDTDNEVLIRSQVYLDTAGFHVVTPLVQSSGEAVLINRGWVPLVLDTVPVIEAPPPQGEVTVEGWIETSKMRGALGPTDPEEGRLISMNRVDIQRIQEQVPYKLQPVYVIALGARNGQIPVAVSPPSFDDEGPHLSYAVQWFGFALVGLVGYGFLIRRSLGRPRQKRSSSDEPGAANAD